MKVLELAHPSLKSVAARLSELVDAPGTGLMAKYPELVVALSAQLPGLVARHQMFAHNVTQGDGTLRKLMRTESWEVVDDLAKTLWRGERVNGTTSFEGADYLVFGSLYTAMIESEGKTLSRQSQAEIEIGLLALRAMTKVWSSFDHVGAIPATVAKNWLNYPETPLKAPCNWTPKQMTEHYMEKMRPALRILRNVFPEGKLPPVVTEHLNEVREDPPAEYVGIATFVPAYLDVLNNIPSK